MLFGVVFLVAAVLHSQGRVIRGHGERQLAAFLRRERESVAGGLSLGFELPVNVRPGTAFGLLRLQILLDAGEEGIEAVHGVAARACAFVVEVMAEGFREIIRIARAAAGAGIGRVALRGAGRYCDSAGCAVGMDMAEGVNGFMAGQVDIAEHALLYRRCSPVRCRSGRLRRPYGCLPPDARRSFPRKGPDSRS